MSDSSDTSKPTPKQDLQPLAPYKKGDFIGQKYEVYGILAKGGFGVVYLVYSHELGEVYALKTFLDEYLADVEVRGRFHREASVWVELGRYPYLVRADFVEEISGRLYIQMEYVAPNEEGLNSLEGYLLRKPPDLAQSLRWGVQICHGMEFAYSKCMRAHRDLKPANIMITQDKTAKITDFGLAGVIRESPATGATGLGASGLSGQTRLGTGMGTPAYMSPEQFDDAAGCDERSDVYSFGVVLYQMATSGRLPFLPLRSDSSEQVMVDFRRLHRECPVPQLDSLLFPVILRCMAKAPEKRYQTFAEVRNDLESLLREQTGETLIPPQLKRLEAWEWANRGASLGSLGRHEEAIRCYGKALEIDPLAGTAWNNKGDSLNALGRYQEAIDALDKALEIDPREVGAWTNKGVSLGSLGRHEEAIRCFDRALELDPVVAGTWINKGSSLSNLGRHEEAIRCFDRALELDPLCTAAWYNKGSSLTGMGRHEDGIRCFDKTVEIDPFDAGAWNNKGYSLNALGRYEEAIQCLDKALQLNPRYVKAWDSKGYSLKALGRYEEAIQCIDRVLQLDPRDVDAWTNKGSGLDELGRHEEAIRCFDKALELDPHYATSWYNKGVCLNNVSLCQEAIRCFDKALELDSRHVEAWFNKGNSLGSLSRYEEAIRCFDKALELDSRHVEAWFNKGLAESCAGKWEEAASSYRQFLALAPPEQQLEQTAYARKRLQELENKLLNGAPQQHPGVASKPTLRPNQSSASTWFNKGTSLSNLGRHEEAIHFYDKALELDGHLAWAWFNKGNSLGALGRSEEALQCFGKALELDPLNVDGWFNKALAEDYFGKHLEAVHSYREFLALVPPGQHTPQIDYSYKRLRELGE